jgi:rRNA-processing protein FCF1
MGCVLITNDRELKKRAKDLGIQVGYLRGLERVEIEGQNRYI